MPARPDDGITIGVASRNTRRATELALRTIRETAPSARLWVGDCASVDGSLDLLRRLERAGTIDRLDVAADRSHGEWIDFWRDAVDTPLLAIADSDVELRRAGWLEQMVDQLGARELAMVSVGAHEAGEHVEPNTFRVRTVPRPEMYLLLVDLAVTEPVRTSFGFALEQLEDGRWQAWDTGARFAADLQDHGLRWGVMPAGFADAVEHWGALSYMTDPERLPVTRRARTRVRLHRLQVELQIARRLRAARRRAARAHAEP